MRRLLASVVVVASLLGGTDRPAAAAGAIVVSGVAVFSPGITTLWVPTTWPPPGQRITITETQQGVFAVGSEVETASLSCTFSGYANEGYAFGSGSLVGSCAGTGITGKLVTKTCNKVYSRLAQYFVPTESCWLQVGSSRIISTTFGQAVAQLPPPPSDRYYYTGTLAEFHVP